MVPRRLLAATLALIAGAAVLAPTTAAAQGPPAAVTLETGYFEVSYDPGGPDYAVVLRGTVNPNGQPTRYFFDYGTTTAYGQRQPTDPGGSDAGLGTTAKEVSQSVSGLGEGLKQDVTYHYRVVGVNASGASYGADRTFRVTGVLRPPSRVGFGLSSQPTARRTRIGFLVLSDAPRGTQVSVRTCRGGCGAAQRFTATKRKHRFFKGKSLRPGQSVEVEARQPNGYGVLTKLKIRRGRLPDRTESCLAPGRKPAPCLAIRVFNVGSSIRFLKVLAVRDYARVEVRCRGGGCPFGAEVDKTRSTSSLKSFVYRGFGRLRAGAVLQVYVTRLNTVGFYQRIVVGRGSVSLGAYRCIKRGSLRRLLRRCPEGQIL
jgi:hypothetical protein